MDLEVDVDRPLATVLAEVLRAATGKKEFFKVTEEGEHISITEAEYIALGGGQI